MARDLPGFYFDEVKGKYFRIQQSHRVIPGTGFTKQSVKAIESAKETHKRQAKKDARQRTGKIVRSKLLQYSTSPLSMRLGHGIGRNREELVKQYCAGLSPYPMDAQGPPYADTQGFIGSTFTITSSGILRASYRRQGWNVDDLPIIHRLINGPNNPMDHPSVSFANYQWRTPRPAKLLTSIYATNGQECAVVSSDGSSQFVIKPVDAQGQIEDIDIELDLIGSGVENIWDIASSPNQPTIAIATDAGLRVYHCREDNSTNIFTSRTLSKKEQMNVIFKDKDLIMSGERSGRVNFTDARSSCSVVRLLHSSAVLGTLALRDANHVVVHGFSTTSTYDLRWVQQTPVSQKARSTDTNLQSQAYLSYAIPKGRASTHYTRGRKLAYSRDLDLVAAASSTRTEGESKSFVTIYSARTGHVVESSLGKHEYPEDVVCIDFKRVRDGPESIFCLCDNRGLEEWAFGKLSYKDVLYYGIEFGEDRRLKYALKPLSLSFQQEWNRGNGVR